MGDVLSHYYRNFFKTDSYYRWEESRRSRSRKCIQGKHIVSGWRQQELLTWLIPDIPKNLKHEIPEVSFLLKRSIKCVNVKMACC